MKISVITTTFNSAAHIERNVKSVNDQSHQDLEQIFVDNLSTDGTLDLIKSQSRREHRIISERDRGISDAFNKGILAANGEIIAILNSDDAFYSSESLTRVHDAFTQDSTLEFVFGDMLFIDPDYGTNIRRPLLCPITEAMPYNHPAFFVRKSFYEKLGLFDEKFRYAMDFELITRMYQSPTEVRLKGAQIHGEPLAIMYAGGASWKHELRALDDVGAALKKSGLWNKSAEHSLKQRRFRVQLKTQLSIFRLHVLVRIWRHFKWTKNTSY
jgi:glycosyltransferase